MQNQQRAGLDKQRADVAAMFDGVAKRYDLFNTVLSLGQVYRWRRAAVAAVAPRPGQRILDLAAGTGTSSAALAEHGAFVVASDISLGMLQQGRLQQPDLDFVAGDALSLPFPDDTFDAVTISYGLRNVEDTRAALTEMLRVTRPGGRVVIADESTARCGFGHDVAALIATNLFSELKAPIQLITPPHAPVPFSPALEREWLPSEAKVADAVRAVVGA